MFAEGAVVGEYTLQRKLGQGPLAEVWRAKKAERSEPAALKLVRPGAMSPSAMRRAFERLSAVLGEAGRLENPHLPVVLGTVRRPSDGLFGVASPYFEGGPLFDAGDLSDPGALHDALELVIQLGQTVAWLHGQGLVHGAIKPGNVLASPSTDGPSIRLLDLCWSRAGLCRLEGTRFEPPELKNGPATPASDQWAVARLMRVLVARRAPEPITAWARVPMDLRHAVDRSLSEDPAQRFEHTEQLVDALAAAQAGLSSTTTTQPDPQHMPAPTIPVTQQRPPSFEIEVSDPAPVVGDPTDKEVESTLVRDTSAPTEPAISDEDEAELRQLAGTGSKSDVAIPAKPDAPSRPPENKKTIESVAPPHRVVIEEVRAPPPHDERPTVQTVAPVRVDGGNALDGIGPTAAVAEIDPSADSAPKPFDPTEPVPEPETGRSGFAFAIAAAATIAITAYAWTVTTSEPEPAMATAPSSAAKAVEPRAAEPSAKKTPKDPNRSAAAKTAPPPKPKPTTSRTPPKTAAAPRAARPAAQAAPTPTKSKLNAPQRADLNAKDHAWTECRNGVLRACNALAEQHERLKYWRAAAKARDQACRLGRRDSCLKAAENFVKAGEGRQARRRFEQLCDNRVARACGELAELFGKGVGGRANPRTARAFHNRACQLGYKPSCTKS